MHERAIGYDLSRSRRVPAFAAETTTTTTTPASSGGGAPG
jgi:hypothetical protein